MRLNAWFRAHSRLSRASEGTDHTVLDESTIVSASVEKSGKLVNAGSVSICPILR
jgi:hypothetical protein